MREILNIKIMVFGLKIHESLKIISIDFFQKSSEALIFVTPIIQLQCVMV